MRLVGARSEEERAAVAEVLREFFTLEDGAWRHGRCDEELAKYQDKQRKAKASADARWGKDKQQTEGNANAMRPHSEGTAPSNQTPVTSNNPLPPAGVDEAEALPACPYAEIVKAYSEELPTLPGVRVMDAKRQRGIRNRWAWVLSSTKSDGTRRATTSAEALRWFRDYFARVRANGWLMGETPSRGHEGWKADLDFLMTDRGLKAVLERTQVAA